MSFDLEGARAVDIDLLAATDWGELRRHYRAALAEIERLRAFRGKIARILRQSEADCDDLLLLGLGSRVTGSKRQAARIKELEGLLEKSEEWYQEAAVDGASFIHGLMKNCNSLRSRTWKAEARIKKLEDALAEYRRLGEIIAGGMPCLAAHEDCDRCSDRLKERCSALSAIAEGKIGPDAKPRVWQITEERKVTLSASLKVLERLKKVNTDTNHSHLDQGIDVLRAMLKEGRP